MLFRLSIIATGSDPSAPAEGVKTARLPAIAQAAGADRYLSGRSGRAYFDESLFATAGIAMEG